ncbi:hypothetical protein W97_08810 [Coniosporium apollinis CBS 100218]|uniref:Transcription factor domain-containing protein n=1 Tax=Coniosporium apollinis (strain CBS 100218) TaxID=1168221 RepID=R7Z5U3_CONA1|nr:uncharacterized protein W97_08810 [Coniosporium apollinis CBS 100218]EON69550.1 hypothetical protein W97_08810 [Coniosporium apollinis CBS 100218]
MGFDLNCPFDLDSLDQQQQQHGYFDFQVSGASYPYIQTSTSQDITPRFEPPAAQAQQKICEPLVLPPKSDAETISQAYFSHFSNEQPYLDRSTFQFCLNAVYSLPSPNAQLDLTAATILSSTPYSLQTAKFHVFIVLATGMRLLGEQLGGRFEGMLESCYRAAMGQVAEVGMDFWERPGGAEAAMLLAAFGKARGSL